MNYEAADNAQTFRMFAIPPPVEEIPIGEANLLLAEIMKGHPTDRDTQNDIETSDKAMQDKPTAACLAAMERADTSKNEWTEEQRAACAEYLKNNCESILSKAGITFVDGADFLAQDLPPPKWIVQDFIAQGMKGDLCGSSKTFKTYLGLQFAICIASGHDFLGLYHMTGAHTVAYFNLELFDWNFQERISAQCTPPRADEYGCVCGGLGIDHEALRGKLLICNLRGNATIIREHIAALTDYLESQNVEVVIIDPRYKLLKPGEDENTGDGLSGILKLRDRLAEQFAVLIVTHDPKGDTTQKKTTDRGAGSYMAGADFDFRFTIDRAEGWSKENLVYVVDAEGRARKTPPAVGLRFDMTSQIFRADDAVAPVKQDAKRSSSDRAAKEAALQAAYRAAAMKVVENAGDKLLSTNAFDNAIALVNGASVPVNRRGKLRAALIEEGLLATTQELERKSDTGGIVKKYHGSILISTPERIDAYRAQWTHLNLNDKATQPS